MYALEIEPYLEQFCREDFKKAGRARQVSAATATAAGIKLVLSCREPVMSSCMMCVARQHTHPRVQAGAAIRLVLDNWAVGHIKLDDMQHVARNTIIHLKGLG